MSNEWGKKDSNSVTTLMAVTDDSLQEIRNLRVDPVTGRLKVTGTGGGHTIQDEGTPLTTRTNLNFVGAGVTVTDGGAGPDSTIVTISGASVVFVYNEVIGTGDDTTVAFILANTPVAGTVCVCAGGLRQTLTTDYSVSGTTVTFVNAPPTGLKIIVDYQK